MSFLEAILAHKREEVATRKRSVPRSQLESMPDFEETRHSLVGALRDKQLAVIAEIKKASPSKSVIREEFNPLQLATDFVQGGASALSVLTDEKFFQGRLESIAQMRHFVPVPILRKDFIIDPYQLYEAKAFGADAVLLIVAALERGQMGELLSQAREMGLECLVEVHTEEEIEALNGLDVSLVGINNRDLTTFEVDLGTSLRLRRYLPSSVVCISESGITCAKDVRQLLSQGIHVILVGEALMRAGSPGEALSALMKEATGAVA